MSFTEKIKNRVSTLNLSLKKRIYRWWRLKKEDKIDRSFNLQATYLCPWWSAVRKLGRVCLKGKFELARQMVDYAEQLILLGAKSKNPYERTWGYLIGMLDNWHGSMSPMYRKQLDCDWHISTEPGTHPIESHCTNRSTCLFCRLFLRDMPWWDGIADAFVDLSENLPTEPAVSHLITYSPIIHSIPRIDVRPMTGIAPWHLVYTRRRAEPYLKYWQAFVKNHYGRLSRERRPNTLYAWYIRPCLSRPGFGNYSWKDEYQQWLEDRMLEDMTTEELILFDTQKDWWRSQYNDADDLDWELWRSYQWLNIRFELQLIELCPQSVPFDFADKARKSIRKQWRKLMAWRSKEPDDSMFAVADWHLRQTDTPVHVKRSAAANALTTTLKKFFQVDTTWVQYPVPWLDLQNTFPMSAAGNIKIREVKKKTGKRLWKKKI